MIKIICFYNKENNLKNTFKVALQYLFNVVILLNTVFYLKLCFKLKIDPKNVCVLLKTLKIGNPEIGNKITI